MRFAAILLCLALAAGQARPPQLTPQPPCGADPVPDYPALDRLPLVQSWSASALGRDWKPPACTGWTEVGFQTLVTTAARFRYPLGVEGLLRQVGAISGLARIRYWSTTHQRWQTLITDSHALSGAPPKPRGPDFRPDNLKEGQDYYFEQSDNLSGKAIYRMHMIRITPDRLIFDLQNVSTMRYFFVTTFHPGDLQTIYFLDREAESSWKYYSIARTGKNANRLTAGHESSAINRAVAFYRHLAGIPTDQEPPAAR